MNYRHAFHAGNFADVMKHACLARMVVHLLAKESAFRVVDTHAGTGLYDLGADEAARTGEWHDGVGRLDAPLDNEAEALLRPYRAALDAVRTRFGSAAYPGSPAILREMLRRHDRAILVEKHPEDAASLTARFNSVANLKVLHGDGWAVLPGLVPPPERRGLVFIDPPYEEPGELQRAPARLAQVARRWPTGTVCLWYPVKLGREADAFATEAALAIGGKWLRLEVHVGRVDDPGRLNGSGLFVINPPWTLAGEAEILLPRLAERLARSGSGGYRCGSSDGGEHHA